MINEPWLELMHVVVEVMDHYLWIFFDVYIFSLAQVELKGGTVVRQA